MSDTKHLSAALQNLKTLYAIGKKLTPIDGVTPPRAQALRTLQLENMVEKIVLHGGSMLACFQRGKENINELDISLILSAARNIMDSTNLYFHISQRGIGKDEIELRFSTLFINARFNLQDIYSKLNFSDTCFRARIESGSIEKITKEIKASPAFAAKSSAVQAQILAGRRAAVDVQPHGILDKNIESALYNLFSNSVHGLFVGLGNYSLSANPLYTNFFSAFRVLTLAFQTTVIYTAYVLKDYVNLRKRLYRHLTEEEKKALLTLKSTQALTNYLSLLKTDFESDFLTPSIT